MNTGNRRVWDFAGDGWVHRLVLQKSDPSEDPTGFWDHPNRNEYDNENSHDLNDVPRIKFTELSDPDYRSPYRFQGEPPVTDGSGFSLNQQEEAMNKKLEYAAYHYNQMVTWQLQHNREQHVFRLNRLR
jgi:hypothetical protein